MASVPGLCCPLTVCGSKGPEGSRPHVQPGRSVTANTPALNPWTASDSQGSQILSGCGSPGASGHAHV